MKLLRQVKPNKGVEVEYRKRLEKLINAMDKSVMYWILADYGNRTAKEMAKAIQKRIKQWTKIFGDKADEIALWFATTVKKHTENGFRTSLREQDIYRSPTIPEDTLEAVKLENKELIKSIPEKYFIGISTIALMAVMYDWDKDRLEAEIEKRHGITERRAKIIASDQNHKSSMLFKSALCEKMGIRYGVWTYTYLSKVPRETHLEMNGTLFDLEKGCYDKKVGEYIFPGQLINCSCSFRPVIEEPGDNLRQMVEEKAYFKNIARGTNV